MKVELEQRHVVIVKKLFVVYDSSMLNKYGSFENFRKAFDDGNDFEIFDFIRENSAVTEEEFWQSESEGTIEENWTLAEDS